MTKKPKQTRKKKKLPPPSDALARAEARSRGEDPKPKHDVLDPRTIPETKAEKKEPPKPKKRRGRPPTFTAERKKVFIRRILEGRNVSQVCSDEDMPSRSKFYDAIAEDAEFLDNYARAREVGAHAKFDMLQEIADDGRNDFIEKLDEMGLPTGAYKFNPEAVQRSKLRIETAQWIIAREAPKVYGAKVDVNLRGQLNLKPITDGMSDEEAAAIYAESRNFDG